MAALAPALTSHSSQEKEEKDKDKETLPSFKNAC